MSSSTSFGGSGSGSTRRRKLTGICAQPDDHRCAKNNFRGAKETNHNTYNVNCVKIRNSIAEADQEFSRFPKLEECAHFHYEHVELTSFRLSLYEQDFTKCVGNSEYWAENADNKWLMVKISSQGQNWLLRRTYDNFRMLDQQLHRCIYDRKFSSLPELPPLENLPDKKDPQTYVKNYLRTYCERFSEIAGCLINCGPILNWFQLDNKGRRILVSDGDNCPINTPAVAAAYAVKKYCAVAADEVSFDVGDIISVIDMPPPEESTWWKGKCGFVVGFFPSHFVAVITDKVPRNLSLNQPRPLVEPSKPVLRKHGKLIAFFRAFILSRPSKRRLKQSGIFKERVFGCDLGEHLLNSEREVPKVLTCCSEFIERFGIVDGIYRLSGASSNIQKLRITFDEDRTPAVYDDDSILQDVHSVASLLKMYFRELPNPLCTYQLYKNFVNAVQLADPIERVSAMRQAVQKLPPPHYRTLEYLMKHLFKISEYGTRTGMTARNIAIVWAPNLLRCKELEYGGVAALQDVGVQAVVTEFLISNVDLVFSDERDASREILSGAYSKSISIRTPTKLLTLEEARSRKSGESSVEKPRDDFIEVGGGPSRLPKIYHTVIELQTTKKSSLKRSPMGWKSFFLRGSKTGCESSNLKNITSAKSTKRKSWLLSKETSSSRKAEFLKNVDEEIKNRLRTAKSTESLASYMERRSLRRNSLIVDYVSPRSPKMSSNSHSRSVSHDSYFNNLAPNRSISLSENEDLSDFRATFDTDDSEMKTLSEDSSRMVGDAFTCENPTTKQIPTLVVAENAEIADPSPKKQKTLDTSSRSSISSYDDDDDDDVVRISKKKSRLKKRRSDEDFEYIDSCGTDKLLVRVDVHHRECSRLTSPVKESTNWRNSRAISPCASSESTLFGSSVFYTPLSESSCTSASSSRELSYRRLSASASLSQLSQFSVADVACDICGGGGGGGSPRKRYSYHEDDDHHHHEAVEAVGFNKESSNRCAAATATRPTYGSLERDISIDVRVDRVTLTAPRNEKQEQEEGEGEGEPDGEGDCDKMYANERIDERIAFAAAGDIRESQPSPSDGRPRSRSSSFESPYEIIAVADDDDDDDDVVEASRPFEAECEYEKIEHSSSRGGGGESAVAGRTRFADYETLPPSCRASKYDVDDNGEAVAAAPYYEDVRSPDDFSQEARDDDFMIENTFYESLFVGEFLRRAADEQRRRRRTKIGDFTDASDRGVEKVDDGDGESDVGEIEKRRSVDAAPSQFRFDTYSFCEKNTVRPKWSDRDRLESAEDKRRKILAKRPNVPTYDNCQNEIAEENNRREISHFPKPDSLATCSSVAAPSFPPPISQSETRRHSNVANFTNTKTYENDVSLSGNAKSVQDLVCIFEWSVENDTTAKNVRDERNVWIRKNCNYVSLPTVLVDCGKSSRECLVNVMKLSIGDERSAFGRLTSASVRASTRPSYESLKKRNRFDSAAKVGARANDDVVGRPDARQNASTVDDDNDKASPIRENSKTLPAVTTVNILYASKKQIYATEVGNDSGEKTGSNFCARLTRNASGAVFSFRSDDSAAAKNVENDRDESNFWPANDGGGRAKSKSARNNEQPKNKYNSTCDNNRKLFTASLERRTCKLKQFVKEESLVAKRVSQLCKASETSRSSQHRQYAEELGFPRRRAHSTSDRILPSCIRDIAAIFENRDLAK